MAITLQDIDAEIERRERIAEIDAEIAKREAQKNQGVMDQVDTGQESLATLISGGIGQLAGGITGAATTALTLDPAAGEYVRGAVADKLTLNPSPKSQEQLQVVGDAVQAVDENLIRPAEAGTAGLFDVATNPYTNITGGFEQSKQVVRDVSEQGLPKYVGQDVLNKTGSPLAATGAEIFTGAAEMLSGNLIGKYTNKAINTALESARGRRKLIVDELLSGNPNTELVTKVVNGSGDIVTSNIAKKALNNLGGKNNENAVKLVSMLGSMDNGTKNSFNKMLDIIEDVKIHPKKALDNNHKDVIGQSIISRVKDVNKLNSKAGRVIGAIANAEKTKPNISDVSSKFMSDLDGLGVRFNQGDDGWVTVNFDRAKFKGGDKKGLEVMINDLIKPDMTFKEAHRLKQDIRTNINYDLGGKDQLTRESEGLLSDLSEGINGKLRAISPEYKKANKKFADTIEVKNSFDKMLGKEIDINDPLAYKLIGAKAMRLDSEAATRVPIEHAINNVDKTLGKFSINYKDDIKSLILTAGMLEDAFKTQPKGSFLGKLTTAFAPAAPAESMAITQGMDKISDLITPDFNKKMKSVRLLSQIKKAK